jgi:hypothetical protein
MRAVPSDTPVVLPLKVRVDAVKDSHAGKALPSERFAR